MALENDAFGANYWRGVGRIARSVLVDVVPFSSTFARANGSYLFDFSRELNRQTVDGHQWRSGLVVGDATEIMLVFIMAHELGFNAAIVAFMAGTISTRLLAHGRFRKEIHGEFK